MFAFPNIILFGVFSLIVPFARRGSNLFNFPAIWTEPTIMLSFSLGFSINFTNSLALG